MAKTDATAVLKSVPLFGALSRNELNDIVDLAREELFSPGQDIVTEGQAGGPFFCITAENASRFAFVGQTFNSSTPLAVSSSFDIRRPRIAASLPTPNSCATLRARSTPCATPWARPSTTSGAC